MTLPCCRPIAFAGALALASVAYDAQQRPPADAAPLVRIDAVVTRDRGQPVEGLRAADFEVLEEGTARPIRVAEFRGIPRHGAAPPRAFAFFLDDFHLSPGPRTSFVRNAAAAFVDEKLFARDLAAAMTPLDSAGALRFSNDRALVHGPIAALSGRKGAHTPRSRFEAQHVGRDPATVAAARRRITAARLRELAVRMGTLQAERAAIVIFSEGFALDGAEADGTAAELEALARAASRFRLSIYAFNPAPAGGEGTAVLERLAASTGGVAVNAPGFNTGFALAFHDTEVYYALAYEPRHDDGRFHDVRVRAKRSGVTVRTHAGYWSTPMDAWSVLASRAPVLPEAGRRPLRRSPAIDRWLGLRRGGAGLEMIAAWEPRVRGGVSPEVVVLTARTESGATLFEGRLAPAGAPSSSARNHARFPVPTGAIDVEMSVYAADGGVLDVDATRIDVPDSRPSSDAAPTLLPPEIVRLRTARELHATAIDSEATPTPLRTFGRHDHLLVRASVVAPAEAPGRIEARLLNRGGRAVRQLDPLVSPGNGVTQFALPLSWLPADNYEIEVTATNARGSISERVSFRLVN
jgi:VWFA-related protein